MGNKKILILVVVLVFLVGLAILAGAGLIYLMNIPQAPAKGTVVEIQFGGNMNEIPTTDPISLLLNTGSSNLWDLRRVLEGAAQDDRIAGLFIEVFPVAFSWAQIEEIGNLLSDFKQSGKPVIGYLAVDLVTEKEMMLASFLDDVSLSPNSGFLVDGMMAEVFFYKRAFDKVGIKPQFIQFKEYKSPETYTRQEMTSEIRGMLTGILEQIQANFVSTVAKGRAIPEEAVKAVIEEGLFSATKGQSAGLVDRLAYKHEVISQIEEIVGQGKYKSVSMSDYLEKLPSLRISGKKKIAFVGVTGTIISGKSDAFNEFLGAASVTDLLRSLSEDSSIDGVILRVDSPGGSAVGSDMIWEEVRRLETANKPVVVSMSGVAGSGGYYISMPAKRLVAQPSTITGSIGVIFGKFDLSGLYAWLGVDIDRIKLAPNSDLFSLNSSLSPEQEAQVRSWIEETYNSFVRKASEGRGQGFEELEAKARGRIYTGRQALEAGLVDAVGGVDTAVEQMKELLQLESTDAMALQLYPKPKTFLETLASGDFFSLSLAAKEIESIRTELARIEQPSIWMLTPEFRIR